MCWRRIRRMVVLHPRPSISSPRTTNCSSRTTNCPANKIIPAETITNLICQCDRDRRKASSAHHAISRCQTEQTSAIDQTRRTNTQAFTLSRTIILPIQPSGKTKAQKMMILMVHSRLTSARSRRFIRRRVSRPTVSTMTLTNRHQSSTGCRRRNHHTRRITQVISIQV